MGVVERTRNTDPITSAEAAGSAQLKHSQGEVLLIFMLEDGRPMTDHEMTAAARKHGSTYTGQRLRSARAELVQLGFIRQVPGLFRPGPTGKRRAHVWALKPAT
ncbi:hypothetical protein [Microbacterium arborescens]